MTCLTLWDFRKDSEDRSGRIFSPDIWRSLSKYFNHFHVCLICFQLQIKHLHHKMAPKTCKQWFLVWFSAYWSPQESFNCTIWSLPINKGKCDPLDLLSRYQSFCKVPQWMMWLAAESERWCSSAQRTICGSWCCHNLLGRCVFNRQPPSSIQVQWPQMSSDRTVSSLRSIWKQLFQIVLG